MSNVLIGIIGVILFIGLALAGALFLGPRFQEATLNSKAATTIQRVSQLAQATNLYEVQEGVRFKPSAGMQWQAMVPGYIKQLPRDVTGTIDLNWNDAFSTPITYTVLAGSETEAKALCGAIVRQAAGSDAIPTLNWGTNVPLTAGCFLINGTTTYVAYARY